MPKLFNEKENYKATNNMKVLEDKKTDKHFSSPIREWRSSIYTFNKNSLSMIPSIAIIVNKIIKSYFNLYNWRLERKLRTKRLLGRFRKYTSNKYYISNPNFKHTNNKVLVNMYVFNRQKFNYSFLIKNLYLKSFFKPKKFNRSNKFNKFNKLINKKNINNHLFKNKLTVKLINRLNVINRKSIKTFNAINKNRNLLLKALKSMNNKIHNINNFTDVTNYTRDFYKILIKKSLKTLRMFFYYRQLLYVNKSKVNYTYLQYLKKYIECVYSKNVEFNIINLKRFYLNSDIMSEAVKLKISRNRKKINYYLKRVQNKIKIWKKKVFLGYLNKHNSLEKKNLSSNKYLLQKYVFANLKHKHVTGFRLQAKGRLNRRHTASRSIHKIKYKGNLLDIDSSFRGLSTVILKGNMKSNIQYSVMKSKTRIGAFGIKGWVSGN